MDPKRRRKKGGRDLYPGVIGYACHRRWSSPPPPPRHYTSFDSSPMHALIPPAI
ncbi:hypothetical protein CGMCC3_g9454 [Colletotrichum fructicola]|nr:uncharacterized protein CGMCC3_g9454 [Colletotrichum fructicola]KAE9574337.1 hypothetical protein CGMCC3_g9454 [Colletotrichum fructicola]